MAAALGYSNPRKALDDHVDSEDKRQGDGVTIRDPIGREQHPTVINESGLYSLALSCATGVAKSLGYANPQKEVRDHCKGSVIRRLPTNGGEQAMKFIPEGDIYRLAAKSEPQGFAPGYLWIH